LAGERRLLTWLPWALCWITLALMVAGVALTLAFPREGDDSAFSVLVGSAGYFLVPLVGALIAARLPTNPYGWLWCGLGVAYGALAVGEGLWRAGAVPGWFAAALIGVTFFASLGLLVLVLLLFPTGRLPDHRWRWLARAAILVPGAGVLVLPFSLDAVEVVRPAAWGVGGRAGQVLADVLQGAIPLMFVLIVLAAASVLVRFRRGGPVERQQAKWFLLAAALAATTLVVEELFALHSSSPVWTVVDAISFAMLPVSVGIAVLRYRLYEIDRIVSRTVSYGLLTGCLVALYLVLVALLQPLLEPWTGSSTLAVAGSTLAVAAVFNPARRRLQAAVDRRFDRARYDAGRAVDAFAARLRDQVDLDEVTAGLRETVVATVAPTQVAVWLRAPGRTAGAAS